MHACSRKTPQKLLLKRPTGAAARVLGQQRNVSGVTLPGNPATFMLFLMLFRTQLFLKCARQAAALAALLVGGVVVPARGQALAPPALGQTSARDSLTYQGTMDVRHRDASRDQQRGSYVAATRFQFDWTRANPQTAQVQGGARIQLLWESDRRRGTSTNSLRASELFLFYDFALPGVSGRAKVGQFVLPFGLMAVYDTSLQPIQTLYDRAIGLRVDTGLALEGEYGPYHWAGALTTGAGPDRSDPDGSKLITFRLGRTVATSLGVFEVGGSLLSGRAPQTSWDTELPASGYSYGRAFVDKTRIAGDGQYFFGPLTLRAELVFGGDGDESVWGYFAEANYKVTPRLTLVALRKLWNFPEQSDPAVNYSQSNSVATTGAGINFNFGNGLFVRALYEFERGVALDTSVDPIIIKRLTLQTQFRF